MGTISAGAGAANAGRGRQSPTRTRAWAAAARPPMPAVTRGEMLWLGAIVLLAILARSVALVALDQPLVSDGLAYFTMAKTAIVGDLMRDHYGNAALYSPGYPLLLSAIFRVFGIDPAVARGLNLFLGAITVILTWALARKATARPAVALLAAFGMAALIPTIAGTEMVERENLSVPMLLAFLLMALHMIETRRPLLLALVTGLVFGCGLMAGVSTIFTVSAFFAALAVGRLGWLRSIGCTAALVAGVACVLGPWVLHVDRAVGVPMLSTNGGINLYVGNNPAATGYYVPLAETPAGPGWHDRRDAMGEAGLSRWLQGQAIDYALSHPLETALLDLKKLVYFWLPDMPNASDENHGLAVSAIRWAGAIQHLAILALAGVAISRWRQWSEGVRIITLAILAFWAIHGLVYVITRYRAPAMPLMLVLAAIPLADLAEPKRRKAVS